MHRILLSVGTALLLGHPLLGADYSAVGTRLDPVIREEMQEWGLRGVAVALVAEGEVVYSAGFGEAQADSVFRCGSISKLFNALAVLQQVEAGRLDLDAPLQQYGDQLLPINPFPGQPAVTLRQLLCHRSGLPREPAVGGYLDPSQPSLAATIASVPASVLVTVPGEKTRYSNLGPSLAGFIVERITGQSFEDYQQARLLGPLGMTNSAWTLARAPRSRIIVSHMRVATTNGGWTWREAPLFDLGTIPAGNLFTTAGDLARFVSALSDGGRGLVRTETLAEMWRPQLTTNATGFGLGFSVGKFQDRRTIGHSGAVYGHSSSLVLLPEEKLGAVILVNEDIANGRVRRINRAALSLLLEAKLGEPAPPEPTFSPTESLEPLAGDYESQSYWGRLEVREGRLVGELSGQPTRFTPRGPLTFAAHSRLEDATSTEFERDASGTIVGFTLGDQTYRRVPAHRPPLPAEWQARLGSYGPEFIPIILSVRQGRLYAMTENMVDYALTPVNHLVCGLPPGMYVDEQMVFLTRPNGTVGGLNFANMVFPRNP